MTADSDVDILIVKQVDNLHELARQARRSLPDDHPPVDIVPATRQLLERRREWLSQVYRPAVAEGIVTYENNRTIEYGTRRASDTLPQRDESETERMVRIFHYRREEAVEFLKKAQTDLSVVKKTGEALPEIATDERLKKLSEYAGPAQYPGWSGTTTAEDESEFCEIARTVYEHARKQNIRHPASTNAGSENLRAPDTVRPPSQHLDRHPFLEVGREPAPSFNPRTARGLGPMSVSCALGQRPRVTRRIVPSIPARTTLGRAPAGHPCPRPRAS